MATLKLGGGGLRVKNPKTLRIGLSKVYCCSNIDLPYSFLTLRLLISSMFSSPCPKVKAVAICGRRPRARMFQEMVHIQARYCTRWRSSGI